uniref:Tpi-CL19954 n=1 Tax=Theba pisana TaxID=145622 RepID=A0A0M4F9T1_9EUPU|nr:Tpi-CL19954 [Theba pisana]
MGSRFFMSLLSMLLVSCQVASFTISSRHERSTDLAEALAILQRQRRRAVTDYLGSDRLLNNDPYALEEDADWLRTADVGSDNSRNALDSDWESNGRFIDVQAPIEYGVPVGRNRISVPVAIEPSRQELEDIFDAEDADGNVSQPKINPIFPEKKKKEEMLSVKGDGKVVQKKSFPPVDEEAIVATPAKDSDSNDGISLDTLTKDEFHALMKAVDKLQKQAVKFSEKTIETPEARVTKVEAVESNGEPKAITIVQPASKEELQAVFDGEESPLVKETEVTVEREPNASGERIIEQQVMSNISPNKAKELKENELDLINVIASELEDNIEAEKESAERDILNAVNLNEAERSNIAGIERKWLNRKFQNPTLKRTIKRAAGFEPVQIQPYDNDDLATEINAQNNDALDDLDIALIPPNAEQFVAKILELQDEVDNLKIVSRLEDLENDVLTDALNEATLAQKEGSVTDMEFESLQQAIRIEEALQKLKNEEDSPVYLGEEVKRGEPWRRKRGQGVADIDASNFYPSQRQASYAVLPESELELSPLGNDIQGIIVEPTDRPEQDPDADVASFFMSNADECPAVQEYSTNCELADLYSLPVDFEARSLCNLHEMCYACGKSLQVGQDQCDLVYRAAASALCRGKDNCVVESEIFLRTMKLKNRYIPHSQPLCRSTCAAQFLGML